MPERDFERLKTSLVSLISHELRTPLTYISASLEMLEIAYESPEMQGDVRRFLNIIDQGVKQLNTTIDELLMFSSLEADTSQPRRHSGIQLQQEVDIQQLVLEVVNILKPTYLGKKQVLEVAIQEDLPRITVDPSKLSEILLQLLSNAIKFTPAEGHIRVMVMEQQDKLLLIVSDTGPGIPAELKERIFDPFYQREDYLIREHGGLGLGLTLVQRFCHAVGARLEVFPEEGQYTGTNFMLSLPTQVSMGRPLEEALAQMEALSQANAEKDAQLSSLKSQLLRYTEDLNRAYHHNEQKQTALDSMYPEMLSAFAKALELRDPFTRGRSSRLTSYARLLGSESGLSEAEVKQLEQACLLCDIGYIGVSDEVLHKRDSTRLSDKERRYIQSHVRIGAEMLKPILPFADLAPVILHHHENWDGSGYPDGLAGEAIPYLSRLIRLIDAFDAMLSERAFRSRHAPDYALQEIRRFAGSQFDPEIVKLFTGLWDSGRLQPLIASLEQKEKG
ncbi:MAG: HD domain-containing phosphohydrolase [Candidatus Sericytochromatia bacterium]